MAKLNVSNKISSMFGHKHHLLKYKSGNVKLSETYEKLKSLRQPRAKRKAFALQISDERFWGS